MTHPTRPTYRGPEPKGDDMSNPDTIALCVSDLLHSDRVDSPAQMRDCIRAVCARLEALAPTEAAAMAATVPHEKLTHELDMVMTDPDTKLSPGAVRALQWCRTWVSVPLQLAQAPVAGQPAEPSPAVTHLLWLALEHPVSRYLMSNAEGRWNGAEKAHCHEELCRYYVAAYRGTSADRARRDGLNDTYSAVHRATQALTDHMDEVIGFPLEGRPDYDTLAPKFFAEFHRLAVAALAAPKGDSNG